MTAQTALSINAQPYESIHKTLPLDRAMVRYYGNETRPDLT
jgi:hypothetical protein